MRILIIVLCLFCVGFTRDNTIRRIEPSYRYEYHGQKDRYNEELLRNDPEVLVSALRKEPEQIYIIVREEPKKEEPVTITTYLSEE